MDDNHRKHFVCFGQKGKVKTLMERLGFSLAYYKYFDILHYPWFHAYHGWTLRNRTRVRRIISLRCQNMVHSYYHFAFVGQHLLHEARAFVSTTFWQPFLYIAWYLTFLSYYGNSHYNFCLLLLYHCLKPDQLWSKLKPSGQDAGWKPKHNSI